MCEPITATAAGTAAAGAAGTAAAATTYAGLTASTWASLGGLAISAASTIMGYQDASSSSRAQEQMIQDGLAKDRAATQRQYEEINETSKDESAQRHTQYLIEAARLKAISGESGLAGATQERIDQEAENNAATDIATIEANRRRQAESAHTQGLSKSTQAGIQLSGIRRPSAMGAGLQIVGAGVQAYSNYKTPPRGR